MDRKPVWLVGAFLLAVILAVIATTPPLPITPGGDPGEPSDVRAFAHVRAIAAEPHSTGTEANRQVREYLIEQLSQIGLDVHTHSGVLGKAAQDRLDYMRGEVSQSPTQFVNIIAILKGSDPTLKAVGLMAHHDTVWGSPGAADDSAGVASLVETMRALKARGQPKRDVILVLTDAEELGLVGARQFFAENPLADRIGALINLEARGGGGIASMFQTGPGNSEALELYARAVPNPATSSLSAYLYSVLPNDTDLTPALERGGYIAYNIAFIGRSGLYHSPLATPENLDRGSLVHMLGQTYALARSLANADRLPQVTRDAVFFDVFGQTTIVYPPWLGWVMLGLASLVFGVLFWRAARDARGARGMAAMGPGGVVAGAMRMLGLILVSGALLYGVNQISGAGSGAGYYDRLAAIPKLTLMAVFACAATVVLFGGRSEWSQANRLGAGLPLLLIGVAGQALVPTAAYFVVIAVFLFALSEGCLAWLKPTFARPAAMLIAALVTGYMLTLGWLIMQGVGPSMPYAVVLPLALAALGWLALWPGFTRSQMLAALFLAGAIGVAFWVRFDPVAPSIAVYSPLKPG